METYIKELGRRAKAAAPALAKASSKLKNDALQRMAAILREQREQIKVENARDMAAGREKGLTKALLDRLLLTDDRIEGMAAGLEELMVLDDPIGETVAMWRRPNGLEIGQRRVPLGVVAIIYEARPNVTADAAGLCLKTGNALILKGGSEAYHSNVCIVNLLRQALREANLPADGLLLVESREREAVGHLLKMKDYVDVVIPRGGANLIQFVVNNSLIPAIETGVGNCHVYIDRSADIAMGVAIVDNAKTQRPSVCNALETLLVHKDIAADFLPVMAARLQEKGVVLRGCARSRALLPALAPAEEEDWYREYGDLILAVKIVDSLSEAIAHIQQYGSGHSEAIVTADYANGRRFLDEIDAAAVYVNASTRFTDGNEFGFGAEIGISTQKLHVRGPMGLTALTSSKYIVYGNGQVRQ